ncbi:hypothetical protein [Streptomyces sp. H39-C1]|uniref:hypothetical protein n=1 Tax=Streptomyces sp. H39-C1 TaxID=3004355 RepID=UPI0022AFAAA8|nr:hypothetical protein [Streptomyces sp. H39-C1]MCZ4096111.1 hypothetical protein [Streptomyces sp. H39-C1]
MIFIEQLAYAPLGIALCNRKKQHREISQRATWVSILLRLRLAERPNNPRRVSSNNTLVMRPSLAATYPGRLPNDPLRCPK